MFGPSSSRQRFAWCLAIALAIRALVPFGFMPGDLFGGDPLLVLCPEGLSLNDADHHHHDSHGDSADGPFQQMDDGCDYAKLAVPDLAAAEIAALPPSVGRIKPEFVAQQGLPATTCRHYRIRAPPRYS